jgi:hypothetical protein
MKRKQDVEKARRWQKIIRQAARSGLSVQEFCRRRELTISQVLLVAAEVGAAADVGTAEAAGVRGPDSASFVLVSENGESPAAGIELVLEKGRRLRIGRGVDHETLRAVLAALEQPAC